MPVLLVRKPHLEKYWSDAVVLNLGFIVESPGSWQHPCHSRPIKSESLWGWTHVFFFFFSLPPEFPRCLYHAVMFGTHWSNSYWEHRTLEFRDRPCRCVDKSLELFSLVLKKDHWRGMLSLLTKVMLWTSPACFPAISWDKLMSLWVLRSSSDSIQKWVSEWDGGACHHHQ